MAAKKHNTEGEKMGSYKNTRLNPVTVDGNTKADRAAEMWNNMSPLERLEIIDKVYPFKSTALRHRACLNYLAEFRVN